MSESKQSIIKKNIEFLKGKGLSIRTLTKSEVRSGKFVCVGMFTGGTNERKGNR